MTITETYRKLRDSDGSLISEGEYDFNNNLTVIKNYYERELYYIKGYTYDGLGYTKAYLEKFIIKFNVV